MPRPSGESWGVDEVDIAIREIMGDDDDGPDWQWRHDPEVALRCIQRGKLSRDQREELRALAPAAEKFAEARVDHLDTGCLKLGPAELVRRTRAAAAAWRQVVAALDA